MRTLILYRHAKSDWADPALSDKQRPLAERGKKAAPVMAEYLASNDLLPDRILCSSSQRTRETMMPLISKLVGEPEILLLHQAYTDGDTDYLNLIRKHGGNASRLMVIGHNPATEVSAAAFSKEGSGPQWDDLRYKYPSGGIAVVNFEIEDWSQLDFKTGSFVSFTKPRDLMR